MSWLKYSFKKPTGLQFRLDMDMAQFVVFQEKLKENVEVIVFNLYVNGEFKLSSLSKIEAFKTSRPFEIKDPEEPI